MLKNGNFDDLFVSPGKETLETTVVRGKQDLKIQGPRLNQTKEDKMSVRRGPDNRLDPIVAPPMPLLEVRVTRTSSSLSVIITRAEGPHEPGTRRRDGNIPMIPLRIVFTHD